MADKGYFANTFPLRLYVGTRGRRSNTKSRLGCKQCKTAHVKCDEAKPACSRCTRGGVTCTYTSPYTNMATAVAPKSVTAGPSPNLQLARHSSVAFPSRLAELRARQAAPKPVVNICFAPSLPGKSQQLLYEFLQSEIARLSVQAVDIDQQTVFGNMIIMSALHFMWQTGSFGGFEATFLKHRGDILSVVNHSLSSVRVENIADTIMQVTNLCFADICLGHVKSAAAHLDGVALLMEHRQRQHPKPVENYDSEVELANRFFIFAIKTFMSFTSKLLQQSIAASMKSDQLSAEEAQAITKDLHKKEDARGGLSIKLSALALTSFFVQPRPQCARISLISADSIIEALRDMSDIVHRVQHEPWQTRFEAVYASGAAARIYRAYASTNADSIQKSGSSDSKFGVTPYCAMFAVATAYLYTVLRFWDPLRMPPRVYRQLNLLIISGLQSWTKARSRTGETLYFWQCFVGGFGLHCRDPESPALACLVKLISQQKRRMHIVTWEEAKTELRKVLWPDLNMINNVAELFWEEIVGPG